MGKNIFLLFVLMFILFITACSEDEEEGIFVGAACSSEGAETCSDDGVYVLLCQSSVWALKYHCNVSIGKRCRQLSNGTFGCAGDEIQYDDGSDVTEIVDDTETVDDPDTVPDTENPDPDTPVSDDNDEPASDFDTTEPGDDDTEETPDPDTTETHDPDISEQDDDETPDQDPIPEGSCNSNADCSGATPHCSLSTSECIANAVFITEYVEGSSNNKAIEIYNGSKSSVSLSNYTLQQANNGNSWGGNGTNFVFNFADATATSISSGQIFVFCNVSADADLVAKCDKTHTSEFFQFNGNDAIALFNGTSIVDQIGIQGLGDLAAPWSVAGTPKATENHTLRRKISFIQGTTDWAASAGTSEADSQWIVLDQDTFDGLGTR